MRWQGFALGFLGLVALEVAVSSPTATKGVGGIATGVGNLAQKILSPTVPAFAATASTTSAASPASLSPASSTPSTAQTSTIPPTAQTSATPPGTPTVALVPSAPTYTLD